MAFILDEQTKKEFDSKVKNLTLDDFDILFFDASPEKKSSKSFDSKESSTLLTESKNSALSPNFSHPIEKKKTLSQLSQKQDPKAKKTNLLTRLVRKLFIHLLDLCVVFLIGFVFVFTLKLKTEGFSVDGDYYLRWMNVFLMDAQNFVFQEFFILALYGAYILYLFFMKFFLKKTIGQYFLRDSIS